jgi:hypothetical protein
MQYMCEYRDALWAEFDRALMETCRLLKQFACIGLGQTGLEKTVRQFSDEAQQIQETLARLQMIRTVVERHCREHGCDPEFMLALGRGRAKSSP